LWNEKFENGEVVFCRAWSHKKWIICSKDLFNGKHLQNHLDLTFFLLYHFAVFTKKRLKFGNEKNFSEHFLLFVSLMHLLCPKKRKYFWIWNVYDLFNKTMVKLWWVFLSKICKKKLALEWTNKYEFDKKAGKTFYQMSVPLHSSYYLFEKIS